jgi:DNA-binding transcriptional LysR family regulator
VINRLSRQYPRIVFNVTITTGNALLQQLRNRDIELGFDPLSEPVGEEDIDMEAVHEPTGHSRGHRKSLASTPQNQTCGFGE